MMPYFVIKIDACQEFCSFSSDEEKNWVLSDATVTGSNKKWKVVEGTGRAINDGAKGRRPVKANGDPIIGRCERRQASRRTFGGAYLAIASRRQVSTSSALANCDRARTDCDDAHRGARPALDCAASAGTLVASSAARSGPVVFSFHFPPGVGSSSFVFPHTVTSPYLDLFCFLTRSTSSL